MENIEAFAAELNIVCTAVSEIGPQTLGYILFDEVFFKILNTTCALVIRLSSSADEEKLGKVASSCSG